MTGPADDDDVLYPNGVDPEGHLAWPPLRLDAVAARLDEAPETMAEGASAEEETYRRLRYGLRVDDLSEAGWGVLAPPGYDRVLDELAPLLQRRAQEAQAVYRPPVEVGEGEGAEALLRRLGVGPGSADPRELPYFLLILGGPDEISFETQQLIAQTRAVGRLSLERLEDYRTYAENVLEAEERPRRGRPEATFFAAVNGDDRATRRSRDQLVSPLADALEEANPRWRVRRLTGEAATKSRLLSLLTDEAPPLLFAAAHGLVSRFGSPHQRERQGALIASEWRGHGTPCPPDFYLTGGELPTELGLAGGIAFLFACFGAGTPTHDAFWFHDGEPTGPRRTADPPFVARLVQDLLSRRGGPSAVIGHVDRAWTCSFFWQRAGQITGYVDTLSALIDGGRVGAALEWLLEISHDQGGRHFALDELRKAGREVDGELLQRYRLAANDARNFVVCGDPAARLSLA